MMIRKIDRAGFRLYGKAWQIRAYLWHLAQSSNTVEQYIRRKTPKRLAGKLQPIKKLCRRSDR